MQKSNLITFFSQKGVAHDRRLKGLFIRAIAIPMVMGLFDGACLVKVGRGWTYGRVALVGRIFSSASSSLGCAVYV